MTKEKLLIGQNHPIARSLRALVKYFKYPNDPLTTETNWYHILRWRLRWLNPFSPYNKGMRWSYFKMFFKVYFGPKPKELREGIDYDQSI